MKDHVFVAMSGGVDSSVAAVLLQQAGHRLSGVNLRMFHNEDLGEPREKTCCSQRDAEDAGGFNIGLLNENFTQDEVSRAHRMLSARQMLTNNGSDAYDEVLTALRAENDKIQNENADDFQYFIKKKRGELSDGATPPHSGGTT